MPGFRFPHWKSEVSTSLEMNVIQPPPHLGELSVHRSIRSGYHFFNEEFKRRLVSHYVEANLPNFVTNLVRVVKQTSQVVSFILHEKIKNDDTRLYCD